MIRRVASKRWLAVPYTQPTRYLWNAGIVGPTTAARLDNGTIVVALISNLTIYNSVRELQADLKSPPEVCLDEQLARELHSPYVYAESCLLDYVSWNALGTGIASPYAQARTLQLMLVGRRCCVRRCE